MNELSKNLNFSKIYFKGNTFDNKLIMEAIDHLSKYLSQNTVSDSPFIILFTYNHIKSIIAYFAILKAGKIAVILDPASKSIEIAEMIEDTDPAALIILNTSSLSFHYNEEIVFRKSSPEFMILSDISNVVTIAYTNAEDGYPKGAMLTEENLLAEAHTIIDVENINKNTVNCALLPYHHLFGLVNGILVPALAGCSSLICDLLILDLTKLVLDIDMYNVTNIYAVPSLYYLLAKIPDIGIRFKKIRSYISGGSKLSPNIYDSFRKHTGGIIREGYGLTESSPACTINYLEEEVNLDSVGKILPCCDIKIMDDSNRACKHGDIGEICISGKNVFKGYFNNLPVTSSTLIDGWLHSGDYGKTDRYGNVYFAGLKKNMLNVAGINVYPKELERLMMKNPNAHSVKVFGEESVLQGHTAKAKVELNDKSAESELLFKEWCKININPKKLPKIISFF